MALIDKEAALDALMAERKHLLANGQMGAEHILTHHGYNIIDELPTVQPERIKGHWIEITSRNHTYKCSVCGRLLVNITDGKNNVAKNYPYCHCGADMRGEQDE